MSSTLTKSEISSSSSKDSERIDSRNNKYSVISSISVGKESGTAIIGQYSQVYAVFIGASPILLSIITSVRNLLQLAGQSPFGRISDRYGRKPLLMFGLLLSSIMSLIFPFIDDPIILLLVMIIYSISFGITAPAWVGMLGDLTQNSKKRASYVSKVTTIGVFFTIVILLVIGLTVTENFTDYFDQYRIIFHIGSICFFIASILVLLLYETAPTPAKGKHISIDRQPIIIIVKNQAKASMRPFLDNSKFRKFVIINAVMSFSMSVGWTIFPYVRERYASPGEISFMWAGFSLLRIFSMLIAGKVTDRYGHKFSMFFGRQVMFFIPIILFFSRSWTDLVWGNIIGGLGFGFFFVASTAYIIDCAPKKEKGTYVGTYQLVMGITTFFGSLSMGILAQLLFPIYGQWETIYFLLIIIAILRFLGALGLIFIEEPTLKE